MITNAEIATWKENIKKTQSETYLEFRQTIKDALTNAVATGLPDITLVVPSAIVNRSGISTETGYVMSGMGVAKELQSSGCLANISSNNETVHITVSPRN